MEYEFSTYEEFINSGLIPKDGDTIKIKNRNHITQDIQDYKNAVICHIENGKYDMAIELIEVIKKLEGE